MTTFFVVELWYCGNMMNPMVLELPAQTDWMRPTASSIDSTPHTINWVFHSSTAFGDINNVIAFFQKNQGTRWPNCSIQNQDGQPQIIEIHKVRKQRTSLKNVSGGRCYSVWENMVKYSVNSNSKKPRVAHVGLHLDNGGMCCNQTRNPNQPVFLLHEIINGLLPALESIIQKFEVKKALPTGLGRDQVL